MHVTTVVWIVVWHSALLCAAGVWDGIDVDEFGVITELIWPEDDAKESAEYRYYQEQDGLPLSTLLKPSHSIGSLIELTAPNVQYAAIKKQTRGRPPKKRVRTRAKQPISPISEKGTLYLQGMLPAKIICDYFSQQVSCIFKDCAFQCIKSPCDIFRRLLSYHSLCIRCWGKVSHISGKKHTCEDANIMFYCALCKKEFASQISIDNHMKSHGTALRQIPTTAIAAFVAARVPPTLYDQLHDLFTSAYNTERMRGTALEYNVLPKDNSIQLRPGGIFYIKIVCEKFAEIPCFFKDCPYDCFHGCQTQLRGNLLKRHNFCCWCWEYISDLLQHQYAHKHKSMKFICALCTESSQGSIGNHFRKTHATELLYLDRAVLAQFIGASMPLALHNKLNNVFKPSALEPVSQ